MLKDKRGGTLRATFVNSVRPRFQPTPVNALAAILLRVGEFPLLQFRVPAAFGKRAIDIGQRAVAADNEPELAARVARIEADAAQRLPPTVRTAFDVAPVLVLLADPRAAVGTGLVNYRAYFPASACSRAPLASTS